MANKRRRCTAYIIVAGGHIDRVPTDLENLESQGKNLVREKSGNLKKSRFHEYWWLFLLIIQNVCHGIHQYKRAHATMPEIYVLLFSSVRICISSID